MTCIWRLIPIQGDTGNGFTSPSSPRLKSWLSLMCTDSENVIPYFRGEWNRMCGLWRDWETGRLQGWMWSIFGKSSLPITVSRRDPLTFISAFSISFSISKIKCSFLQASLTHIHSLSKGFYISNSIVSNSVSLSSVMSLRESPCVDSMWESWK